MSSTDSALLAAASIWSTNVLPLIKPRASDRERLRATQIAIPVFGAFAVVVALYVQAVYDLIMDANSVMLACITVPCIAGVWWRKANRTGVLASMAAGFITWVAVVIYAPNLPGDFLGLLVCLVTLVVVALVTQKIDPPRPARNNLGEEIELTDRLGVAAAISSGRIGSEGCWRPWRPFRQSSCRLPRSAKRPSAHGYGMAHSFLLGKCVTEGIAPGCGCALLPTSDKHRFPEATVATGGQVPPCRLAFIEVGGQSITKR